MGDDNAMANLCCENDKDRLTGTMTAVLKCVACLAFAVDRVQPEHLGQKVWLHSVAVPEICACAPPRLPAIFIWQSTFVVSVGLWPTVVATPSTTKG